MKNIIINQNIKMKMYRLLFIPLVTILLTIAGCSKQDENGKHDHETVNQKGTWTCPMHPQVISDRPGICPICNMDLVKKVGSEENPASENDSTDMVALGRRKQVLANVSTVVVKKEKFQNEVTAYSYMDFVENNRKTISARFNGRIEKLLVDKTGDYIKIGQPLFEIYSPDLVQAQNDFIIALNNSSNFSPLIKAARKKLELFGLTSEQINNLEKMKEINLTLTYYSPFNGTVIEKKVQEGMYVNEGTAIYDIAELSTLWNIAEVYEKDISNIKVGNPVKLYLRAYPGEEFNGRVSFIYPLINSQTRTVKVRSEFSSKGGKLKPQMYGETIFSNAGGEGLLVPADAVIIAGKRAVVWVKTDDRMFEARNILIGKRFVDKYQIVSGLNEGDEIVATGGFLLDSESQLKSGTAIEHQQGKEKQVKDSEQEKHQSDAGLFNEQELSNKARIFNAVCPVLGNEVSGNVNPVEYRGKLIGFCCAGCDKKFMSDPEKYMKNLSTDGKTFIGKKASY